MAEKIFNVKNLKKDDLIIVAEEIGIKVLPEFKIKDLREKILESEEFNKDSEFVANFIVTTVEDRKIREEHERQLEIIKAQNVNSQPEPVQRSEEIKIGEVIKTIKTLTIPCPSKPELWHLFFTTLERAFENKKVDDNIKAEILLNLLGEKAANILIYIEGNDIENYEKIKFLVLREFEPTAQKCLDNFNRSKRQTGETHMQFASRLKTNFDYYLRLRKCDDFKTLCDLIVSDKLFSSLDQDTQMHVGIRQGEKWFKPLEMGQECDTFYTSKGKLIYRQNSEMGNKQNNGENSHRDSKYIPPHLRTGNQEVNGYKTRRKACFLCGSMSHLQRECNKYNTNFKSNEIPKTKTSRNNSEALSAKIETKYFQPQIPIQPLEYVTIIINGQEIQAIKDSGTQVPVLNPALINNLEIKGQGKIILTSAFGENTEAQLCRIPIVLKNNNCAQTINEPVEVLIAITEKLNVSCLLPPSVCDILTKGESVTSQLDREIDEQPGNLTQELCLEEEVDFPSELKGKDIMTFSVGNDSENSDKGERGNMNFDLQCGQEECLSEASQLKKEQINCKALETVRKDLKMGKGNFYSEEGLIFNRDKVLGETVSQLVLPYGRREKVLKLAHESVFGSHMGFRKTKQRIRYNFFWPEMSKDIAEFCKTCEACQLRQVNKISDRAPITAVARPTLPFQVVNIDIIGKIEPPSGRGHHYILCLIDQHTRWPEAVPLRSLSAKATCNALLEIFMRTGIPNIIASDCGTNFVASLTQEFMHRLGSTPRFSTPGYAASNGLIERWNRVLKNMLHHIIREDPTNWDKQLPFLLWAYREVPNATTGISPFRLMYGREAKGPLAILKSTWAGEIHIPTGITETAAEYLQKLKVNLEIAAEKASLVAAEKQKSYEDYFNRRSSCRDFKVGEQVVLLIPDSSNKLYARWTGPGEITERCSQHSYKVKLPDGAIRHIHVNKMKKFYPRAQTIGVIFEDDEDFGEICPTPVKNREIPNFNREVNLEHLNAHRKKELLNLLDKHSDLFSGRMKIANVGKHKIKLVEGAVRRKPHVYRIPEALKTKVDEQIKELLSLDLIEISDAEIAYPIVCVNKKDGTIRLCVDFRALNEVTIKDDFPMENVTDLINTVGQGNIITTLDILKGYWEIPLEENSRDFTSFKTHRAQYRWKVMAFGLKNSGATFQKTMNRALADYLDYCKVYIDDVAVYSPDWKTHLEHLDTILNKLNELNFAVNIKKCEFAKNNLKYLGHIIGSGRHEPDPEKLRAIKDLHSPKTKKELQSILGICNYYRGYVKGFTDIAYPLTELTKKGAPEQIPWTEKHETSFTKLKTALCDAPSLFTPIVSKPYTIQCDASGFGVGACLSQRDETGVLRPVSFASKKLNKTQQSWPAIEREAFAIVWSLKKFETWIFGSPIELQTDHNPLIFITKGAPQSAKLQRWALALQRYDLRISHCAGKKIVHADALSRLPID